jgi:deazaflavin-dependent oxidoreductase (nitroreductase family)
MIAAILGFMAILRLTVPMSVLSTLARRYGGQEWFASMGRAYLPVDRFIGRLTKGRFVALGMRDLPSLMLTTTGRRSGKPRTNPLLFTTDGDAFIVIGSNWGQPHHPAWSGNLLADPRATVTLDGKDIAVRARLVTDAERARLWDKMRGIWPAYEDYKRRASSRDIRVFLLERVAPGS